MSIDEDWEQRAELMHKIRSTDKIQDLSSRSSHTSLWTQLGRELGPWPRQRSQGLSVAPMPATNILESVMCAQFLVAEISALKTSVARTAVAQISVAQISVGKIMIAVAQVVLAQGHDGHDPASEIQDLVGTNTSLSTSNKDRCSACGRPGYLGPARGPD